MLDPNLFLVPVVLSLDIEFSVSGNLCNHTPAKPEPDVLVDSKYNTDIPSGVKQQLPCSSNRPLDVLKLLPDHVVEALEDHADAYGLTDNQVLELAISQFLDLDSVSLGERRDLKGVGALRAENEILKMRLRAAGLPTEVDAELPDPDQN